MALISATHSATTKVIKISFYKLKVFKWSLNIVLLTGNISKQLCVSLCCLDKLKPNTSV